MPSSAEFEFVDLRELRDDELLERTYREVYLPSFPLPEEQEDPSTWRPLLWGEADPDQPTLHFLVAGRGLDGSDRELAGLNVVRVLLQQQLRPVELSCRRTRAAPLRPRTTA